MVSNPALAGVPDFPHSGRKPPSTRGPVNPTLLIEQIVRQTTVLIGQLATSAGLRAPLMRVADQVFLELVRELSSQGVRQKVVADMFGMALRTYQKKVQRLTQSESQAGQTLWEAIYDKIAEAGVMSRAKVLSTFHKDDDATVRGILKDMVESQLIFESGTGSSLKYRVASKDDLAVMAKDDEADLATFLWATVYRLGPATLDELRAALSLETVTMKRLLDELVADGRVQLVQNGGGQPGDVRYRATQLVMPLEGRGGWATAIFDHYQAVIQTILSRLNGDDPEVPYPGRTGGSTWTFDVWPGHPFEEEVVGLLTELRQRVITLQERVFAYNEAEGRPARHARVTFYLGQAVKLVRAEPREGK